MNTIQWGIIGCGDIVMRRVGPALKSIATCEIAAVTRSNSDLLDASRVELKAERGFADWRDLLAKPRPADAVINAKPDVHHSPSTI